jgi:hypothetical protein
MYKRLSPFTKKARDKFDIPIFCTTISATMSPHQLSAISTVIVTCLLHFKKILSSER